MPAHILLLSASFGLVAMGLLLVWAATLPLPDFNTINERRVAESTKIYDRTGEVLLYDVYGNVQRTVVPLDDISRYVKNATIAIEDDEFYSHKGVKPLAFLRALFVNLTHGGFKQGGSTITQQVVKNTLLTPEKKISRKLKEWILAIKLEQVLSKEEILALYLNEAPYGGSMYGIEEASRAFFGKSANDLDLAESAYLASLPKAPTYYSPYGNSKKKLDERKNIVLKRMLELGFISQEEYAAAINETVAFLPQDPHGIRAPHFVAWVKEYLAEKYGEEVLMQGGLKVITTIDYPLQQKAEAIVAEYAKTNEGKFNAKNTGMVGIDPKTGQVLVMVGSRDYFDMEHEGNFNVALAHRQPGSAFKPFVYATAFAKGYTPETVVFDLETQFSTACDSEGVPLYANIDPKDCYMPRNYDNTFRGPITLRNALAQSINIPAIKVLYLAGLKESLETAKKMGIEGLESPSRYGLTLVLGGGEVSLLDITSAYGVFANEGMRNPYANILRIEDKNGNVLEEFTPHPEQVITREVALQISDILSDNKARAPIFGEQSPLYFKGRDVAAKTGTTNDYRDAWVIGYTPSFALGAWVGNNDNSSMEKKVAGFIVTPMWNAFMKEALATTTAETFEKIPPETSFNIKPVLRGEWRGGIQYFIDAISGKRATQYTPEESKQERVLTQVHDILYWIDKNDPRGETPTDPGKDPQFALWEKPVREWAARQGITDQGIENMPNIYDDVHTPALYPTVAILSPAQGQIFDMKDVVMISINSSGNFPLSRVDFFINGVFIGSSKNNPFNFSFSPSEIKNIKETNQLKAVVYDSASNKGEAITVFSIRI